MTRMRETVRPFGGCLLLVLGLMGCGTVLEERAPGTRGGDCVEGMVCDHGLECVRGVCVPEGTDDAGMASRPDGAAIPPPIDGGPPRVRDAGPPVSRDAGGTDAGPPPPAGRLVVDGLAPLYGIFPLGDGDVIVVDAAGARRLDAAGAVVATFAPPREVTAAAFDGTYLAIADRGVHTALDTDLTEQSSVLLAETCASAVIVSGHRFVCGPDYDWDRIFVTYDLERATEIARSDTYTYNGIPMRRVPGTDDFITVTEDLSPSDFHLYDGSGDPVVYVQDSPYHGDFTVSTTYAFHGFPATHLVTQAGIMLRIRGPGCMPDAYPSECLVRDGELGTVSRTATYAAMTQDTHGHIVGLVDTADRWYDDPYCAGGCTLHEVESATRTITRSRDVTSTFLAPAVMEVDPADTSVLLGVYTAGDRFDGYTTYEIWRLAF